MGKIFSLYYFLLSLTLASCATVTQDFVDEVHANLREIVVGRLAAHMVRAVFHDCVGGCDGCINRGVPPNMGPPGPENWIATVDALDNVYNFLYLNSGLSRADFYVLAAQAGIENAVENANAEGCPSGGCVPIVTLYPV